MEANNGHGRALTTNPTAAGWYRLAQQQAAESGDPCPALRRAVEADAAFALAAVDLGALSGVRSVPRVEGPLTGWERHHCEVVAAAVDGEPARAAALLRLHLADVGSDPLAARIVDGQGGGDGQ